MKRKLYRLLLPAAMICSLLVGCGLDLLGNRADTSADSAAIDSAASGIKVIGVAMPTQSAERWINDGANMKEQLEALGYKVDLQYADDDIQAQISQIEHMISKGVSCLVISSVDSFALVDVLEQAKAAGIPVIAYDRLLMDTDAVSYHATFDNKAIGTLMARYVEEKMALATAQEEGRTYNVELFMGSPDDNNAYFVYNGIMEVITPYLESGVLVCQSGQVDFASINTLRWSEETARERCEDILSAYYSDKKLDIVITAFDGLAYGVRTALESAGYTAGDGWPMITAQDADTMACRNILSGHQTMTIYKDAKALSEKCVTMVQAVLEDSKPEINDTEQYNNNVLTVPTYLCVPIVVDKDNIEEVIVKGGYYSAEEIGLN